MAEPESYRRALSVTNRRHDVIAVDLNDPLDTQISNVGLLALEDPESGEIVWADTSSQSMAERLPAADGAVGKWQDPSLPQSQRRSY